MTNIISTQSAETMTSLQIAEATGKEHKSVLRDIRNVLRMLGNLGGYNFVPTSYNDSQGKVQPSFCLTKKDCLLLASGYDVKLRAAIINRWEELENINKPAIPQTFAEALMLAAQQAQQIEMQQAQLAEAAPKVEFFDAVADSRDAIPMNDAAKVLAIKGYGRNNLFEFLRNKGVLMRNNQPYQRYIDSNHFRVIEQRYQRNGEECINIKTLVYQKGLNMIRKLIEKSKQTEL